MCFSDEQGKHVPDKACVRTKQVILFVLFVSGVSWFS